MILSLHLPTFQISTLIVDYWWMMTDVIRRFLDDASQCMRVSSALEAGTVSFKWLNLHSPWLDLHLALPNFVRVCLPLSLSRAQTHSFRSCARYLSIVHWVTHMYACFILDPEWSYWKGKGARRILCDLTTKTRGNVKRAPTFLPRGSHIKLWSCVSGS